VPGESLGFGTASQNGQVARMLTLSPGSKTLLVSVIQSKADARVSGTAPLQHQIKEIPVPPEAVVLSAMSNADTRTAVERLSLRMPQEGLSRYFSTALKQSGWTPLSGGKAGMGLYVKGADLCVVMVTASDSDGGSRATLLHKRGAVE